MLTMKMRLYAIILCLASMTASSTTAEREERYLVKPTTDVSADATTLTPDDQQPSKPAVEEVDDLDVGDSSLHPVSQPRLKTLPKPYGSDWSPPVIRKPIGRRDS